MMEKEGDNQKIKKKKIKIKTHVGRRRKNRGKLTLLSALVAR